MQGGEAVAPDPCRLRLTAEVGLLQGEGLEPRIVQLQAPCNWSCNYLLQLGMGTGGDEGAIRLDHHVAAIPCESLLGDPGARLRHAGGRFDGVEVNAV